MTKTQLRQIIFEAVKKSLKKANKSKTAGSYITSPQGQNPTLYINIKVEANDLDEAEELRESILKTLEKEHKIKAQKES